VLRFSLFGVPVSVHWGFWVTSLLLGGASATGARAPLVVLAIWCAAVAVSVLVHEFGHALAFRRFGGRPQIHLYWLGGLASSSGRLTRQESVLVSLAGPAAGLVLGGLVWAAGTYLAPGAVVGSYYAAYTYVSLVHINIAWSLINLLPVMPLDGGRVLDATLGHRNQRAVYQVGFVLAVAVSVLLFMQGWFGWVLFAFLAYENFQRLRGVGRGWY
jgi:Zn-dependent protease